VTDGRRVYVVSFNGKIAALSFDGQIEWTNTEVDYYSQHGLAVSPILHEGLLIIPFDGSSRGEDKKVGWQVPWEEAFILALDVETGKVRWRARRGPSRIAHVTPNILGTGADAQLVSGAGNVVQGFDLATGRRLWSVASEGEGVVPSIVLGDDLVYSASGFGDPTIRAVRPGTRDDPGRAAVVWEQTKNVPSIPSFVLAGKRLFSISQDGIALAMDGAGGEIVWRQRIGGQHSASPIYADGRIWFLSEEGQSTIIQAEPPFETVATNSLGEKCQASYAVSGGQIFIRTAENLYCIGAK
jgi:outer membrane protein assembly factor BamB